MVDNKHPYKLFFYNSVPAPCPYLKDQTERKLFTELFENDHALLNLLTKAGFRRSHDILYRPDCEACKACIPSRINISLFDLSHKSVKRFLNKNKDLTFKYDSEICTKEAFALFQDYQKNRHPDSEMRHMSYEEFLLMFFEKYEHSKLLGFYNNENRLIGYVLYDLIDDGASAIYSVYTPSEMQRSIGKFMIYRLIKELKDHDLPYLYLGYWIEKSPEMAYKGNFRALEILLDNKWVLKP